MDIVENSLFQSKRLKITFIIVDKWYEKLTGIKAINK